MKQQSVVLAQIEGFGRIYNCGDCSNVHLQVGAIGLTLTIDEYMRLVDLVNTSASNFERQMSALGTDMGLDDVERHS